MKKASVIILAGQSNAVGVGHVEYLPRHFSPEKVSEFQAGYPLVRINYFSHDKRSGGFVPTGLNCAELTKDTFGPELGIAEYFHSRRPDEELFIVKAAVGATSVWRDFISPSCGDGYDPTSFADQVELDELAPYLRRQIDMNLAIAKEGLTNDYGACIGKLLYNNGSCDLRNRAKAYAAAGSDARMSGCELPVCILSGSGNQGMTASLPVIVYAQERNASEDLLLRSLIVSDLITLRQKTGIGCLSAYCGAISAGCGSGCGICYLEGGRFYEIAHTLVNAVAILSGTICDGAKPSCAAKIAMSVDAGIMGYEMMRAGHQFYGGDGIITKGVENTIDNVGRLARDGMDQTDKEIIRIMLGNTSSK